MSKPRAARAVDHVRAALDALTLALPACPRWRRRWWVRALEAIADDLELVVVAEFSPGFGTRDGAGARVPAAGEAAAATAAGRRNRGWRGGYGAALRAPGGGAGDSSGPWRMSVQRMDPDDLRELARLIAVELRAARPSPPHRI
jgi:hypothetical protein